MAIKLVKMHHIYMHGNNEDVDVTIGGLPQYRNVAIAFSLGNAEVEFTPLKGFYFFNRIKSDMYIEKPITTRMFRDKSGVTRGGQYIFFDLPEPLAKIDTTIQGGGLNASTIKVIQAGENDVHRFVIPFSLYDEEYLIDVSFHVKLRTKWTLGIPGT